MALGHGRVAMVSMHTSPVARLGTRDAGGMNLVILETAKALAARGIHVEILTRAEGEPTERVIGPKVILRELAAGPQGAIAKESLSSVADEFGEAVAAAAGRSSPRYDVIHAHYWLSGLACLPVTIELGIPLVQSFHTLGVVKNRALATGDDPEPHSRLASEAFIASQADAVVASSAAEVEALIDEVGTRPDRAWVVRPGVDADHFSPDRLVNQLAVRESLGLPDDRPILALVGRVQPLKGHHLAVQLLARLVSRGDRAPVLVIAGEPTPGGEGFVADLRVLADSLGVGGAVFFVGALDRDQVADLFAAASVTLVPSHSESFGLVALESAASGTPVVASNTTGLVDAVANGESGVLVDGRDPETWAITVATLLDAVDLDGDAIGRRAREFAERHSWASAVDTLVAIYESL